MFITFEGIEGSGKTTLANKLYDYLKGKGLKVYLTKEPGGTKIGLKIREILLSEWKEKLPSIAELLLYEADRNIHIHNVIKPLLKKGYIVISDRFYHSTIAYQCYGRGIDYRIIKMLNNLATEGIKPDITFLLDLPVEEAFKRLNREKDRIEKEDMEFHKRVRDGFLDIAKKEDNIIVLDGMKNIDDIFIDMISILKK